MQINEENYKLKIIRANCGISLPNAWNDIVVEWKACPVAKNRTCAVDGTNTLLMLTAGPALALGALCQFPVNIFYSRCRRRPSEPHAK